MQTTNSFWFLLFIRRKAIGPKIRCAVQLNFTQAETSQLRSEAAKVLNALRTTEELNCLQFSAC